MAGDGLDAGARRDIEALIELLKAEDRRSLRGMTETELIRLHHGYGTWLRNQFRRNKFSDLPSSGASGHGHSRPTGFGAVAWAEWDMRRG